MRPGRFGGPARPYEAVLPPRELPRILTRSTQNVSHRMTRQTVFPTMTGREQASLPLHITPPLQDSILPAVLLYQWSGITAVTHSRGFTLLQLIDVVGVWPSRSIGPSTPHIGALSTARPI